MRAKPLGLSRVTWPNIKYLFELLGLSQVKRPSVETSSFYLAHFKSVLSDILSPCNATFCIVTFGHASYSEANYRLFENHSQADDFFLFFVKIVFYFNDDSRGTRCLSAQTVVKSNLILIRILNILIYGNSLSSRHGR